MAKKRVHEIAKEREMPSKEVLGILQKAGIDVKAAASSVDEADIKLAFEGGKVPSKAELVKQAEEKAKAEKAAKIAAGRKRQAEAKAKAEPSAPAKAKQAGDGPRNGGGPARQDSGGASRQGQGQRSQPGAGAGGQGGGQQSRSQPPRTSGPGGRRRRVVIDSQANRGPQNRPFQQQPPRRRGRRRRTAWVEPTPEELQAERDARDAPKEDAPSKVNSGATVKEVAESLGVGAPEVIKKLMELGEMATLTQTLPDEAIELLAGELDKKVEIVHAADEIDADPQYEDNADDMVERPPVVTVMGHVDHGKTSLLDAIRETEVAAGEAGGITQHIGAYQVHHEGGVLTFLDTPGHQAFTAMRARGAKVTDVAVIVVAADDGVMPQTQEAIDHAKAADVPIMVAVNKIDVEGADPNRVRGELAAIGITPADWGGDTEFVDVSAKTKENLGELIENLVTLSELLELKANPSAEASGSVIESKLDPGRGPVVSILISRGTLVVGDAVVAGAHWGRVRAMHDYRGGKVEKAEPGEPVEILGFDGVPEAGEHVHVVPDEKKARVLAAERGTRLKTEALARRQGVKVSLEDVFARAQKGEIAALNLIVKADVAGSLEALEDEIAKLPQENVRVDVIHDGVGGINESDVMLASASDAIIIGFNVRPVGEANAVATREGVEIRGYTVIYNIVEELKAAMQGLLAPEEVEQTVSTVEIRQIFKASRVGTIAGSMVMTGTVTRGAMTRLVRDGRIVYDGRIGTLRRFKEDVREVQEGFECGITLDNYADIKEGDSLEVYETKQVEREL